VRFRRLTHAAVAVLAVLTAAAIPSQAWAAPDGPWMIFPQSTFPSKCLELPHANTATGTNVDIYTCPSGITPLHMRWEFLHQSDGTVQIQNKVSNKCATPVGGTLESGAFVDEEPCANYTTWIQVRRQTGSHDYYQFRTPGANLCLNVRGNGTANDTLMIIYTCTSGVANDLFTWIPARQ